MHRRGPIYKYISWGGGGKYNLELSFAKIRLLEVRLPHDPSCLCVSWSDSCVMVGQSISVSVIISSFPLHSSGRLPLSGSKYIYLFFY